MPAAAALKVLIVDDQFSVRQMTRMTLEQLGIRNVYESENGKVALILDVEKLSELSAESMMPGSSAQPAVASPTTH